MFVAIAFIALIYLTCRAVDKCIARNHWFHHNRGYVSAKDVRNTYVGNPTPLNNAPILSNISSPTSNPFLYPHPIGQSLPSSPMTGPRKAPRTRRTTFVGDVPMGQVGPPMRTVTSIDRLNNTFGLELSAEQRQGIMNIIRSSQDGIANENAILPDNSNNGDYDVPPVGRGSSFGSNSSTGTVVSQPRAQVHQQPEEERLVPQTPMTPRTQRLVDIGLPVRCFLFYLIVYL